MEVRGQGYTILEPGEGGGEGRGGGIPAKIFRSVLTNVFGKIHLQVK